MSNNEQQLTGATPEDFGAECFRLVRTLFENDLGPIAKSDTVKALLDKQALFTIAIVLNQAARESQIFRDAAADLEIAAAALARAHAGLITIPEDHRDSLIDLDLLTLISQVLKGMSVLAKEGAWVREAKRQKRKRPVNSGLYYMVGYLAITYIMFRGRRPTATYDHQTGEYKSEFINYVMPALKEAGYADNERACARNIPRILDHWGLRRSRSSSRRRSRLGKAITREIQP